MNYATLNILGQPWSVFWVPVYIATFFLETTTNFAVLAFLRTTMVFLTKKMEKTEKTVSALLHFCIWMAETGLL